jgi:hypothetical protein
MSRNNRLNDTDARRMTRVSSPCSDTTPPQLRVHRKTARPSQPECIIGTIVGTNTSPESIASYTSTNATTSSARSPNTVSTTTTTTSRAKKSNQAAQAAQSRKEKELVQTTVTQLCREFAKKKKQQGKQKKEESSDDDDDLSEVIYVASSSSSKAKKKKVTDDQYIECIGSTPPPSYPRSFYTPTMSDTTQSKQSRNVKRMRDIMAGICNHCQNVICHDQEYGGFIEAKIDNVAKQTGKQVLNHIEIYEHCITIYSVLAEHKVYNSSLIVKDNVVTLPTCLYTGTYKRLLAKWLSNGQDEKRDMLSHVAWSHLEQEMQNRKRRARKSSSYKY